MGLSPTETPPPPAATAATATTATTATTAAAAAAAAAEGAATEEGSDRLGELEQHVKELIDLESTEKALKGMDPTAGAGRSGINAAHLKQMHMDGFPVVEAVHAFARALIMGRFPAEFVQVFTGADIIVLRKAGKDKIRPVSPGEAVWRLITKAVMEKTKGSVQRYLAPQQLGVAVKSGAEAIANLAAIALQEKQDWTILSLDIANAFPSVDRGFVLKQLKEHKELNRFVPLFEAVYTIDTHVTIQGELEGERHHFFMHRGLPQGCPLSGVFFSIAMAPALKAANVVGEEKRQGMARAYLDDTVMMGNPDTLAAMATVFDAEIKKCGLHLNQDKTICIVMEPAVGQRTKMAMTVVGMKCEKVDDSGVVLGVPIGNPNKVSAMLEEILQDIKKQLDQIVGLGLANLFS